MLKIYNSLSKKIEEFKPIHDEKVGMYTCGPTVYDYVSIGNWRTYFLADVLLRTLEYLGYEVDYVMNITDVGHLTGDNEGDADTGEDRMEKASARENKSAWEVAKFYTEDFLRGFDELRMVRPRLFARATDHIQEQIELVKKIEKVGMTYKIDDGIYFDVKAYEDSGKKYGELSTLDVIKEGARVEKNKQKRDPRDFALWKFNTSGQKRDMEWESPWGLGFPGWHVECSAMSMKYLGEQFDVHVGGEDLRSTHHPNEVAQSEAATGKEPYVKYWIHGRFLTVDGGRMGKSLGNAYTIKIMKERKVTPEALRYFYLTGHYRKQINFTWEAVHAAKSAYANLVEAIRKIKSADIGEEGEKEDGGEYQQEFRRAIEDDINMPQALAVLWSVVKSDLSASEKMELIEDMDKVFGLGFSSVESSNEIYNAMPREVQVLVGERDRFRQLGDYKKADELRDKLVEYGYEVEDAKHGPVVKKK